MSILKIRGARSTFVQRHHVGADAAPSPARRLRQFLNSLSFGLVGYTSPMPTYFARKFCSAHRSTVDCSYATGRPRTPPATRVIPCVKYFAKLLYLSKNHGARCLLFQMRAPAGLTLQRVKTNVPHFVIRNLVEHVGFHGVKVGNFAGRDYTTRRAPAQPV